MAEAAAIVPPKPKSPPMWPEYEIYLWEPNLSPHKLGLYHAIKAHPRVRRAVYVAEEGLPEGRRSQGWSVAPDAGDDLILHPSLDAVQGIVREASPDAIHVFSGLRHVPAIVHGLQAVRRSGRSFGIMSEPRAWDGVGGLLRLIQSWATEGEIRRRARFILAIGAAGPAWFRRAGYPPSKIFPYAYFLPLPSAPPTNGRDMSVPTIGYLGRLEASKGFDIFLEALGNMSSEVKAKVAGNGSLSPQLAQMQSAWGPRLEDRGVIAIEHVPDFLEGVDILVAPSVTKDGWGAVVSEALMSGAAVVTSRFVGASLAVEQDRVFGRVVASPDALQVASAVDNLIRTDLLSPDARSYRRSWARAHLASQAGAETLIAVLDHAFHGGARPPPFYEAR